jgi:predicted acyltransferase
MTLSTDKRRFEALDVFRGLTIAFMIIVNTPGDWGNTFSLLLHADWHGFTPTDLVFPSFLFAVGNALAFVAKRWETTEFGPVFKKVFIRTLIIFILGYTMYLFPFFERTADGSFGWVSLSDSRILGVLQRIALAYFFAAIMIYFLKPRAILISSILILLAYWFILYYFGDYTLENNAIRTLDLWLFGPQHLYGGDGIPFDPEGLLSTLPSIVNVLAGFLLGVYVRDGNIDYKKLYFIMAAGVALLLISYLWHPLFPVNKKIWTSSFVTLTVGLDLVLLGILIYLLDIKTSPVNMSFFRVFGKNPLFSYLLSQYLVIILFLIRIDGKSLYGTIYRVIYEPIGDKIGSLLFALSVMLVVWLATKYLDKRGIIIKV